MNPRDAKLTPLTDVNILRLIRRDTSCGPPHDRNALSEADDEVPRGACLSGGDVDSRASYDEGAL